MSAHSAESAIISAVVLVLPQRSPSRPPTQQPIPPIPITAKVASAAPLADPSPSAASEAPKKTANQAHIA